MVLDRFTKGTWTSPEGKEWLALFGASKVTPLIIFSSEEDMERFYVQMNKPS